ncbi:MAG: acyl-CoA carboxylase subunit beta [Deltaproteobacteria bacterium]|nr:acyl-CoA carboxylase subunit beta [Deltaproteobacteria bacterium]
MDDRYRESLERVRNIKAAARQGGGDEKITRLHEKGKMSARERVAYLLDEESFVEHNLVIGHLEGIPADGLVAGHGTIAGRTVCVYAQDTTVRGGSIGPMHGFKMYRTIEWALDMGVPCIGILDSPGARVPDMDSRSVFGEAMEKHGGAVFYPNTQASGLIPQISAVMGSCAGISVYSPALTDFIYMVDGQSHMFVTGPAIVGVVTGETVTKDELGGAEMHCRKSGLADGRFPGERELLDAVKELLTYLPQNADESPATIDAGDDPERSTEELIDIVPSSSSRAYDVRKAVSCIVDGGRFFEIKAEFAPEVVVGFARLGGMAVGIVANQPRVLAGCLTVDSSDKQTRFMRFCDCFNIPLIMLVDTSAYLPGKDQEQKGLIRHGAKVLYALCESTVPRIGLVMRKAYGGGNLGMGVIPGQTGTDMLYYWPTAELGVMGAQASVELYFGDAIAKAENPEEMREQLLSAYRERYANPLREASANPFINDVIEPRDTRRALIRSLRFLSTKRRPPRYPKRHGNMPV